MLSNRASRKISILAATAAFVTAHVAFAQGEAPAAQPTTPPPAPGGSVHDQMVGRIGVGYLGTQGMVLRPSVSTINGAISLNNDVSAPVIGVRYWLDSFMGIDAGLGFTIESGSDKNAASVETDQPSTTAFIIHGGLPLSLLSDGHFSFQIVPELNLGLATGSEPNNVDVNGFHFDLGARAGAEVDFGFIGIPRLSLQAGVGAKLALDSYSTKLGSVETSGSRLHLGTSLNGNPWDIFTGNIAALYYF